MKLLQSILFTFTLCCGAIAECWSREIIYVSGIGVSLSEADFSREIIEYGPDARGVIPPPRIIYTTTLDVVGDDGSDLIFIVDGSLEGYGGNATRIGTGCDINCSPPPLWVTFSNNLSIKCVGTSIITDFRSTVNDISYANVWQNFDYSFYETDNFAGQCDSLEVVLDTISEDAEINLNILILGVF